MTVIDLTMDSDFPVQTYLLTHLVSIVVGIILGFAYATLSGEEPNTMSQTLATSHAQVQTVYSDDLIVENVQYLEQKQLGSPDPSELSGKPFASDMVTEWLARHSSLESFQDSIRSKRANPFCSLDSLDRSSFTQSSSSVKEDSVFLLNSNFDVAFQTGRYAKVYGANSSSSNSNRGNKFPFLDKIKFDLEDGCEFKECKFSSEDLGEVEATIHVLPFGYAVVIKTSKSSPFYLDRCASEIYSRNGDEIYADLMSEIAHSMRTPLQQVFFTLAELKTSLGADYDDPFLRFLECEVACVDALKMLTNTLDHNRLLLEQTQVIPDLFNVVEAIEEAVNEPQVLLRAKQQRVALFCHFHDNLPGALYADGHHIKQIVVLLLENAVKFSNSGGAVIVSVSSQIASPRRASSMSHTNRGELDLVDYVNLKIDVVNNGTSFSEEEWGLKQNEFAAQKAARLDPNTDKEIKELPQLGHAICYHLTEMLGGTLRVVPTAQDGTIFRLSLRCAIGPPANSPTLSTSCAWHNLPSHSQKSEKRRAIEEGLEQLVSCSSINVRNFSDSNVSSYLRSAIESRYGKPKPANHRDLNQMKQYSTSSSSLSLLQRQSSNPRKMSFDDDDVKPFDPLTSFRNDAMAVRTKISIVPGDEQTPLQMKISARRATQQVFKTTLYGDSPICTHAVHAAIIEVTKSACVGLFHDLDARFSPIPETTAPNLDGFRVLVAEDETVCRKMLKKILKDLGCIVFEAVDGKAALDYVLEHYEELDCAIMDNNMPKMQGLEAIHRIRRWEATGSAEVESSDPSIGQLEHATRSSSLSSLKRPNPKKKTALARVGTVDIFASPKLSPSSYRNDVQPLPALADPSVSVSSQSSVQEGQLVETPNYADGLREKESEDSQAIIMTKNLIVSPLKKSFFAYSDESTTAFRRCSSSTEETRRSSQISSLGSRRSIAQTLPGFQSISAAFTDSASSTFSLADVRTRKNRESVDTVGSDYASRHIQILLLTASAFDDQKSFLMLAGVDHFMLKPYIKASLAAVLLQMKTSSTHGME